MRATCIARAIGTSLVSIGAAHGQAPAVTLYGRLNLDVEVVEGRQVSGTSLRSVRLSSNSSRLGVRGSEPLGGGTSVVFQIESSVVGDTGGGTIAGRETFVGFQGPWGTVKVGNFLSPYYDYIHPVFGNSPTFLTSVLSTGGLWAGGGGLTPATGSFQLRGGNAVRYDSASWRGLSGSAELDFRESSDRARIASLGGGYRNGPLQVNAAWTHNTRVRGPTLDDDALSVAAAYDFGGTRLAVVYERLRYDGRAGGELSRNLVGLSGTVDWRGGQAFGYIGRAGRGFGSACEATAPSCSERIGGLAAGTGTEAWQYEISYTYPLSKRTFAYVGFVEIRNAANASYTFDINPVPISAGGDARGIVGGMMHLF